MDDIVERLRAYPMSSTARLEDDAANEIERLREEAGYAKLMYDKHMAEKLTRAEAVIEAADELYTRFLVLHTTGQIEIPAEFHKYVEDLGVALEAHDKERDDD